MHSTRSVRHSVTLSEVVAAFQEGRASTNEVLEVYFKDRSVLNIVSYMCKRVGLESEIDDIRQEVGVLLARKFLGSIVDASAIYGVVKQTAKNICIDTIRKKIVRPEQSLDEMIEKMSSEGDSSGLRELQDHEQGSNPEQTIFCLDQQRAIGMFNLRLQDPGLLKRYEGLMGLPVTLPSIFDEAGAVPAKPRVSVDERFGKLKKHNTEADRLLRIRDTLGISNEDFARLLGLTDSMLCFYLYNSRRKIPPAVMEEANSIMGQMDSERIEAVLYLQKNPIDQVVADWMVRVGVDPKSKSANEDFGNALNVYRSTIWRWRTGKHVPKMSVLVRSHLQVLQLQKRHKEAAESMA